MMPKSEYFTRLVVRHMRMGVRNERNFEIR